MDHQVHVHSGIRVLGHWIVVRLADELVNQGPELTKLRRVQGTYILPLGHHSLPGLALYELGSRPHTSSEQLVPAILIPQGVRYYVMVSVESVEIVSRQARKYRNDNHRS